MYKDNNEKAVAFGESYLRTQLEPKARQAHEDWKRLMIEEAEGIKPGKANARTGKNKRDLHNEKIEKAEAITRKIWVAADGLHSSIEKLKNPPASWESLDEYDVLALRRHHRAEISKYTGTDRKSFCPD